jgi:hypothetical protein
MKVSTYGSRDDLESTVGLAVQSRAPGARNVMRRSRPARCRRQTGSFALVDLGPADPLAKVSAAIPNLCAIDVIAARLRVVPVTVLELHPDGSLMQLMRVPPQS